MKDSVRLIEKGFDLRKLLYDVNVVYFQALMTQVNMEEITWLIELPKI